MIQGEKIRPSMPVVGSNDRQFAYVDRVECQTSIRLVRDINGQHYYIPLSWVTSVDERVHIDRPVEQAMREWLTQPPSRR